MGRVRSPEYQDWAESFEITPFRLGQLAGANWTAEPEYPDDLASAVLIHLVEEARDEIVPVLRSCFGGTSGLFLALWRSNKAEPLPTESSSVKGDDPDSDAEEDTDEYEDDDELEEETDDDILNDTDGNKVEAFAWLEEGCQPVEYE